jgi:hypothetical protein
MPTYGPLSERNNAGVYILLRDESRVLLRGFRDTGGGQEVGERLGRHPNEVARLWETRKQQELEDTVVLQLIQEFLEING